MNFLQLGMLSALGAMLIPILIHLMFRRQSRPIDLGTLQFLRIVLRDNSKRRRLKRFLLLALRMAGVALIAFIFARPYLLANEPVDGKRLVVILVDRSASMGLTGGKRPIDAARTALQSILTKAGQGTQIELALFDCTVDPQAKPTEMAKRSLEPSATGTDYGAAMAWARDVCVRSKAIKKKLHILTDLQRSGLDRGESVRLPSDVTVDLIDLGRSFPKNVGIIGVIANPESLPPNENATIIASVRNSSPLPAEKVPVRLHLEANAIDPIDAEKVIDLDGNATLTVEFLLSEMSEGLWRGYVESAVRDSLAIDDKRYFALSVAPAAKVLLVDGDPGRTAMQSETFFLNAALRLAPEGETYAKTPFDPHVIDAGTPLPDLVDTSAVVLANVGDLSDSDATTLAAFVRNGGGLVLFTGDKVISGSLSALDAAGLGVGKVVGSMESQGRLWRLESWDEKSSIFRPFADPEHGDLRRPAFLAITKIDPDPSARVFARFRGGSPALLERKFGSGRVILFATAADRDWGDWPRGRLFVPMIHQILSAATGLADGGRIRTGLAARAEKPGIRDNAGIVHVVNPDPYESDLTRCTAKQFADHFGFKLPDPKRVATNDHPSSRVSDDRLRGDELWPWLALGLLGVLMLEHFLANRTAA